MEEKTKRGDQEKEDKRKKFRYATLNSASYETVACDLKCEVFVLRSILKPITDFTIKKASTNSGQKVVRFNLIPKVYNVCCLKEFLIKERQEKERKHCICCIY